MGGGEQTSTEYREKNCTSVIDCKPVPIVWWSQLNSDPGVGSRRDTRHWLTTLSVPTSVLENINCSVGGGTRK